ncbi:MAG TPA: ribosome silencing factor [Clostridiaceae bacterium]|nr:ribosome silencing factor [Clostridiaceae bacterium]
MKDKIIEILEDKKAKEINIINIRKISTLADYFIICSGTSTTHIRTLADEVEQKMHIYGYKLLGKEGYSSSRWILLDYGDVVVHIFNQDERKFYNLERLWYDGEQTSIINGNSFKQDTLNKDV